jgi:tetratricopeptide (TPR) repeat protein
VAERRLRRWGATDFRSVRAAMDRMAFAYQAGLVPEALAQGERLRVALRDGEADPVQRVLLLTNLAVLALREDSPRRALEYLDEAGGVPDPDGSLDLYTLGQVALRRGEALLGLDRPDEALVPLREADRLLLGAGPRGLPRRVESLRLAGDALERLGLGDEAHETWSLAAELAATSGLTEERAELDARRRRSAPSPR